MGQIGCKRGLQLFSRLTPPVSLLSSLVDGIPLRKDPAPIVISKSRAANSIIIIATCDRRGRKRRRAWGVLPRGCQNACFEFDRCSTCSNRATTCAGRAVDTVRPWCIVRARSEWHARGHIEKNLLPFRAADRANNYLFRRICNFSIKRVRLSCCINASTRER